MPAGPGDSRGGARPLRPAHQGAGARCGCGPGGAARHRQYGDPGADGGGVPVSGQRGTHPAWCTGDHSPDGGHSSEAVIVEPDGEGLTRAVLYLWQPPGSPVMLAAELSGDQDGEAMLYLL